MVDYYLHKAWEFFANLELVVGLLWAGLAALTVAMLVLMRTRWGQSRPLRKCVVLSLLAHLLFVGYATTVQIVGGIPSRQEPMIRVTFVDGAGKQPAEAADPVAPEKPWEQLVHERVPQPELAEPERQRAELTPEPERRADDLLSELPGESSLDHLALAAVERPEPKPQPAGGAVVRSAPSTAPEAIDAPRPDRRDAARVSVPEKDADRPRAAPETPTRNRTVDPGVPTALLEQAVPVPRLDETPVPDPASALAGLTAELARAARSERGQYASEPVEREAALAGTETALGGPGGPPHAPKSSVAERSTLVALERRPAGGGLETGAMRDEATIVAPPRIPNARRDPGEPSIPGIYRLRVAPDRSQLAERHGATPTTEAAVKAALKWLADNQADDGRWDASDHGGGREMVVGGRNRYRAGIDADTGITGLALLALLASGHTHEKGEYRENVRRGLEFLLRSQAADGNLGGGAGAYAAMYCHAMAAFALSEAYGMTGDYRLRRYVVRAVDYSVAAQSRSDGGWRYRPGDPGDTSQAGWQLMALKSAELAGIHIPVETRNGLIRYLRSVAGGVHGGLASYRPNEQLTRPMTAEALVCWQFLGMPREHPASNEAGDYLLGELPGAGEPNFYYWYYGTLGMYQLQGTYWEQWNAALRRTLLEKQRQNGQFAGSWDPDCLWGGYGGRVYTTAMAALCLEVYYRFLPLYAQAANGEQRGD